MASKFSSFDPEREKWPRFVKRLNNHFEVQGIAVPIAVAGANAPPADTNVRKRRAWLLDTMGVEVFNKLIDKHGSDAVDAMDFNGIVQNVGNLINPAPLVISERFSFHKSRQKPGQSAADFMLELQKIALTCQFGDDAQNPEQARLRDQFICGLTSRDMQVHLLQQANLTFDNCVQLAHQYEQAHASSIHGDSAQVNQVSSNGKSKTSGAKGKPKKCPHCGRIHPKIPPEKCYARNGICHNCKKPGHFRPVCPDLKDGSSQPGNGGKGKNKGKGKSAPVAAVDDSYSEEDDVGIVEDVLLSADSPVSTPLTAPKLLVDLQIGGKDVTFIWDTGSGATLISSQLWNQLGKPKLQPAKVRFKSFSGHQIPVLGISHVNVNFRGATFKKLPLVIVRGQKISSYPILGRSWQKVLTLQSENCYEDTNSVLAIGDHMPLMDQKAKPQPTTSSKLQPGSRSDKITALLKKYSALFDGSLGCLKNFKASLVFKSGDFTGKKFWKPRPVPYALANKVALELKRLEERGIIEKIPNDVSDYASPIVVV